MSNTDPNAVLTPEQIVEQIRALQAQFGAVSPLTAEERRIIRAKGNVPQSVVDASINVIGAADNISQAVGMPAADVRQMVEDVGRWTAVEGELRAALNGVAGANLVRRQRVALITAQAYNIGRQLMRDPSQAALVPHVQEVKRLRKIASRKKHAVQPTEPAPTPAPTTAEETPKE